MASWTGKPDDGSRVNSAIVIGGPYTWGRYTPTTALAISATAAIAAARARPGPPKTCPAPPVTAGAQRNPPHTHPTNPLSAAASTTGGNPRTSVDHGHGL